MWLGMAAGAAVKHWGRVCQEGPGTCRQVRVSWKAGVLPGLRPSGHGGHRDFGKEPVLLLSRECCDVFAF